jgi:surface antigen
MAGWYAPKIGHWVREVRDYNGSKPNRRKELVAVIPELSKVTENADDMRQLKKQFQNALEWNKKDMPEIWAGPKNQLTVNISPTRTFRHADGSVCRQFTQSITLAGSVNEYYGIACRDNQGSWKIPRR